MRKFYWIIFVIPFSAHSFSPLLIARYNGDNVGLTPIQVWLSEDRGVNWTLRGIPDSAYTVYMQDAGLGIASDDNCNLYLVCLTTGNPFTGGRFYFSSDTGATWEHRSTITTTAVENVNSAGICAIGDTLIYVYLLGASSSSQIQVYKSTDKGYNWTQTSAFSVPAGDQDPEGEMCFISEDKLYIGEWSSCATNPCCYFSFNGSSWSLLSNIDAPSCNTSVRTVGIVAAYGILYATTWTRANSPLQLYKSTDEGTTWTYVTTVFNQAATADGMQSIGVDYDNYMYVGAWDEGANLRVFRSDDMGNNWAQVGEIPPAPYGYVISLSFTPCHKAPPTGVDEGREKIPTGLLSYTALSYGECLFRYNLNAPALVELKIYDIVGKHIATVVSDKQAKGIHTERWQAHLSGVYFYQIRINNSVSKGKILVIK